MFLEVLIVPFLLVAVLIIYVLATLPKVVKISRTQLIEAPADRLFPYINNPVLIQKWNPFVDSDQNVKLSYSGPAEGVNAQWSWEGKKSGAGRATILESEKNKRVSLKLDFKKPFNVTNYGEYSLAQNGAATEVTWIINETATIPRVMSRLISLDRLIGKEFERGLLKLKALAETTHP